VDGRCEVVSSGLKTPRWHPLKIMFCIKIQGKTYLSWRMKKDMVCGIISHSGMRDSSDRIDERVKQTKAGR
jgi:hypothetical protein